MLNILMKPLVYTLAILALLAVPGGASSQTAQDSTHIPVAILISTTPDSVPLVASGSTGVLIRRTEELPRDVVVLSEPSVGYLKAALIKLLAADKLLNAPEETQVIRVENGAAESVWNGRATSRLAKILTRLQQEDVRAVQGLGEGRIVTIWVRKDAVQIQ